MTDLARRRLVPALPFSVLTEPGVLRLIGGEDIRLTLRADGIDDWGARVFAALDGRPVADILPLHAEAGALIERLLAERALTPATPALTGGPGPHRAEVLGDGPLADRVRTRAAERPLPLPTAILVQQTLDLQAARDFDAARRDGARLWVSCGAVQRGYVSPLLLPDAGPCLRCLLDAFERRSPAPELYEALRAHTGPLATADATPDGLDALTAIVGTKLALAAQPDPPSPLYALHVVELPSLATSLHAVAVDPGCPCQSR